MAARADVEAASAEHVAGARARTRLLIKGNAVGVATLGGAVALVGAGWSPMELPVAAAIAVSPVGPVAASWLAARRATRSARSVAAARARWVAALEATGLETMGGLAARRVAVRAWERRKQEAAAVEESSRPHVRSWYRLAGPGSPPTEVEAILARVDELRAAQRTLFGLLLHSLVEDGALEVLEPPEGDGPPPFLAALDRIRNGAGLRLFRSS